MKCIFTLLVLKSKKTRAERIRLKFCLKHYVQHFGRATFVMDLELSESRKLARVNVLHVMDSIETKGFFLQMPPEGLIDPNAVAPEGLRGA